MKTKGWSAALWIGLVGCALDGTDLEFDETTNEISAGANEESNPPSRSPRASSSRASRSSANANARAVSAASSGAIVEPRSTAIDPGTSAWQDFAADYS